MNNSGAQAKVMAFAKDRGWDINMPSQRGAHLQRELGKLYEHILFAEGVTTKQPKGNPDKLIGDIYFSLLQLANTLDVDIEAQLEVAMKEDAIKYPAEATKAESHKVYKAKMRKFIE